MNEAQALLETCFSYYENPKRRNSSVDELPDEISQSEGKNQFFPFKLLVLSNSIKLMNNDNEGIGNLMQLLDLLWKRLRKEDASHTWWGSCSEIPEEEVVYVVALITIDHSIHHTTRRYSYQFITITW